MERTLTTANPSLSKALWRGYKDTCFPTSLYSRPMDPPAGSPWTPETFLRTGFHLIHRLNLFGVLSKPPSHRRNQAGVFSIPRPLFATVSLHSSFPFQASLLKKELGNKRVCGWCPHVCLLFNHVPSAEGKKKSPSEIRAAWKILILAAGERGSKRKKNQFARKILIKFAKSWSWKFCSAEALPDCVSRLVWGLLELCLDGGLLSVKLTARSRCGWRELTLKIEMALGKTRKINNRFPPTFPICFWRREKKEGS